MVRPFAGSAAPIAAFVAITRRQAERTRTRSEAEGRSEAEDGKVAAILFRDAKAFGRGPREACFVG